MGEVIQKPIPALQMNRSRTPFSNRASGGVL
uniref:Uncharacterized protein n=1 Tax=Anguilla anguilla TaxID=7936 RepID=A0A0E9W9D4_ANGAN